MQEYQQGVLNEAASSSRNERSPVTCKTSNIMECKRKPQMKDVFYVSRILWMAQMKLVSVTCFWDELSSSLVVTP